MDLNKIMAFLNNPFIILIIIFSFTLAFFLSQSLTSGFGHNFLSFGPTNDINGNASLFIGIKLDSWKTVITAYLIIFITAVIDIYFNTSIITLSNNIDYISLLNNVIPISKMWTYILFIIRPLFLCLLYIIKFYATATLQIQYILPQLLGSYLINIPNVFNWLSGKKFI
jgi:hypothetical protein